MLSTSYSQKLAHKVIGQTAGLPKAQAACTNAPGCTGMECAGIVNTGPDCH
ncbi:hypothetical protein [Ochrobactrum sp. AN78]|uniref:hypothetical protein n=1 Tax=Ochrobactrum sp. AN78 TaxID=3039853 RepID=UPI002989AF4E|nr:hypothetical protein [Ochrobactrum sp. AN78]MDH7792442.1 hypothetical protein [Ochrobactrum sp. AN78]